MGPGLIALFGAGSFGRQGLAALAAAGLRATCVFDNDASRWGSEIDGVPVREPSREAFADIAVVWLTSMYAPAIARQLVDLGIASRVVTSLDQVRAAVVPTQPRPAPSPAPRPRPTPRLTHASGETAVEIVLADRGWILERCARELESRLSYARIVDAPTGRARLTYYVNYSAMPAARGGAGLEAAFFTHVEDDVPAAADRFFEAGRRVDVALCMAARYATRLREAGARDVRLVTPGVDLDRFQPRVRIGVAGRAYHTGRKGEALVAAVMDEPGIEWHFTGSGWPRPGRHVADADLPAFYREMDYILVPARYEGGPMSVLEALASGVEVIAPDVGFVDEYPHIAYERDDPNDLRRVLRELVGRRQGLRQSVAHRTWDAWAADHDRIFGELLASASRLGPPSATVDAAEPATASTPRLRVLLALHAPETIAPTGGPSIRVRQMQQALAGFGIDADVATSECPHVNGYDVVHAFNVWEPESARLQLAHVRAAGVPIVFSPILLDLFEGLWSQRTILPVFRAGHTPDVVERELARLHATPMDDRRALGAALSPAWEAWPATVREITSLADHLLVLSTREIDLLDQFGALTRPCTLVHNGVDLDWRADDGGAAFREHLGIGEYVLCVGRVEPRKNQLLLAHALRETGLDLVLIGDTPKPDYQMLVQAAGARVCISCRGLCMTTRYWRPRWPAHGCLRFRAGARACRSLHSRPRLPVPRWSSAIGPGNANRSGRWRAIAIRRTGETSAARCSTRGTTGTAAHEPATCGPGSPAPSHGNTRRGIPHARTARRWRLEASMPAAGRRHHGARWKSAVAPRRSRITSTSMRVPTCRVWTTWPTSARRSRSRTRRSTTSRRVIASSTCRGVRWTPCYANGRASSSRTGRSTCGRLTSSISAGSTWRAVPTRISRGHCATMRPGRWQATTRPRGRWSRCSVARTTRRTSTAPCSTKRS